MSSSRSGFAATRLDDIAKRAGVAKGTIYLHFKDKESMFEELIRTAIVPLVNRLAAGPPPVRRIGARHDRGVCPQFHPRGDDDTARRHRAPDRGRGAAVSRASPTSTTARWSRKGLPACAPLIELGIARGEIKHKDLAQFPADPDRAGDDRGDLAEPVCATCAAGRERNVSRASRFDFWRTEDDMTSSRTMNDLCRAGAGRRAGRLQRAQGSRLSGLGRGRHDLRQPRRSRPRDQAQRARGRRGEARRRSSIPSTTICSRPISTRTTRRWRTRSRPMTARRR